MDIQIEPEAPSTIKFLQFVCQELLSHEPLRRGKLIEVHIEKGATPFPEFTENVLSDEKDIKIAKEILRIRLSQMIVNEKYKEG